MEICAKQIQKNRCVLVVYIFGSRRRTAVAARRNMSGWSSTSALFIIPTTFLPCVSHSLVRAAITKHAYTARVIPPNLFSFPA